MTNGIFQNLFLPFSFSLTARICNILDPFAISVDWLIYSLPLDRERYLLLSAFIYAFVCYRHVIANDDDDRVN